MLTQDEKKELTKRLTEYAEAEMLTTAHYERYADKEAAIRAASMKFQNVLRYIEEIS